MKTCGLIVALLVLCFKQGLAQRPKEIGKDAIEIQRNRTNKDGSEVYFKWNIDRNEIFENKYHGGISKDFSIGFGHFFADRSLIVVNSGLYSFSSSSMVASVFLRDYNMELGIRQYFFRRAETFFELGVRAGVYKKTKKTNNALEATENLSYFAPSFSVGYDYLVTSLHPVLNNRMGVTIEMSSLIPINKELLYTSIPFFPQIVLELGLYYHFNYK